MLSGRSIGFRLAVAASLAMLPARADHTGDVRSALESLRANRLGVIDKIFLKSANQDCADRLLSLFELGGFYHLGGDARKSAEFFNLADAVARNYEGRAVVSAGASARSTGAVLFNDSVLRFEGYGYDKVMARTLNALNYTLMGDLEGARVEVRKAEEYQKLERERRQREIQRADRPPAGAEAARVDNPAVQAAYGRMFDQVRNVRNSFENAFTYYLASQIYLAGGDEGLEDAMVEIRRAAELAPQCPAVASAYQEIAQARDGGGPEAQNLADLDQTRDRLEQLRLDWAKGFRVAPLPEPAPGPAETGSVLVCFEAGLVPPVEEVKLSLPASGRMYALAFPIYRDFGASHPPLAISAQPPLAAGAPVPARTYTTTTILETRALAVKSLQERMPGILARGLLSAAAKGEMQKRAEKEWGLFGGLVSAVATLATTSADRRAWQSLPAEVQVAQFSLPAGPNTLSMRGPGWLETVPVTVAPGSRTFLVVRAFPGYRRIDLRTFGAPPAPL